MLAQYLCNAALPVPGVEHICLAHVALAGALSAKVGHQSLEAPLAYRHTCLIETVRL